MRDLVRELLESYDAGQPVALTMLVETRGSTPQKAGAAMLVYPSGHQSGTLGGGCVEAEVKRRALAILAQGPAELLTFQLDSDYGWDDGLICGGRMRMLVHPVRPGDEINYLLALAGQLESGRGCTEAIVLDSQASNLPEMTRFVFDREGKCIASQGASTPSERLIASLKPLVTRPRPYTVAGVSYLTHVARGQLLIVGGGHVGQKVAELAAGVDFDVSVVDDRPEYVTAERFPSAIRRIAGAIEQVLPNHPVDEDTFCLVVTRGHNHDEEALFHLIRRPSRYLGMIGSRRKIKLIFDDLRRQGIEESLLARVHAPLGLQIGSQTVAEIAISIVAELIACRNLGEIGHPENSATISVSKRAN